MLKNYLLVAWRNLLKNRFFSLINILGLSAGIAFCFIIMAYVWQELHVNSKLRNLDRQFVIESKWKEESSGPSITSVGPIGKWLQQQYPSLVANYYRWDGITSNVSRGDKVFRELIQIGDSSMINMFGFKLLRGDPSTALKGPFKTVITDKLAEKFFGRKDVMGETLTIQNMSGSQHDFVISAVLETTDANTVIDVNNDKYQLFIPVDNLDFFNRNMEWANASIFNLIELQPGVDPKSLQQPMKKLLKDNAPDYISSDLTPQLVPVNGYNLRANNAVIKKLLWAMSAIAGFILLMAVINFVNLSISRAGTRMREIGVRKVMGCSRSQLIVQFLFESTLLVFIATFIAILFYQLGKGLFDNILDTELPGLSSIPLSFYFIPLLLAFVISFAAGFYPALVLSLLKVVESLKGKFVSASENMLLRKSLVTFQFMTAAVVVMAAIIIAKQVNLFFSKDLGFDKDLVVSSQVPRNWTPEGTIKMEQIRKQFETMPEVLNASLSYEVPDGRNSGPIYLWKKGGDSATGIMSQALAADEYYADTYGLQVLAGEFFGKPGAVTDSFSVVINETQAKAFGWKTAEDAIGQPVVFATGGPELHVAAVVKDFHFTSMDKQILPITLLHVGLQNTFRYLSFKIKPDHVSETIASIERKWKQLMPGAAFDYHFTDERIAQLYKSELRLKKASYSGTVLAIIIVLLGVVGLISLSIQRRTKEIGIRKVLGSSIQSIIALFLKEFMGIAVIGSTIAIPVAWWLMQSWLNNYAYRVELNFIPFLLALLALVLLTSLLISLQTIKVANENPVKSLKVD